MLICHQGAGLLVISFELLRFLPLQQLQELWLCLVVLYFVLNKSTSSWPLLAIHSRSSLRDAHVLSLWLIVLNAVLMRCRVDDCAR